MDYRVVNMKDYEGGLEAGVRYYHSKWGGESNFDFFFDAIKHSSNEKRGLPRFYLLLKGEMIAGCAALVTNDFISRHDLRPWLAGLYVEQSERGQELGSFIMEQLAEEAKRAGYAKVYLTTDHNSYYERYGWIRIEDGYEPSGERTRIYQKEL